MAPVNPLQRAGESLRTARDGTARTARWVGSGIASGPRRARGRMAAALGRDGGPEAASGGGNGGRVASDRGPGPLSQVRSNKASAAVWAAGGLLVAAWIGWTTYVWAENGSAAGIGVLISWPAVFAALALLSSPAWGPWLLKRHRRLAAAGGPAEDDGRDAAAADDANGRGDRAAGAGSEDGAEAEAKAGAASGDDEGKG